MSTEETETSAPVETWEQPPDPSLEDCIPNDVHREPSSLELAKELEKDPNSKLLTLINLPQQKRPRRKFTEDQLNVFQVHEHDQQG